MAQQRAAFGTLLKMGVSGSPGSMVTIALVSSIKGPTQSASMIDVTSHDNATGYREFVAGVRDAGEITFTCFFDPSDATHKDSSGGLIYEFNAGTEKGFELHLANTSPVAKFSFDGIITKIDFNNPVDGASTADVTIKISGEASLT